MLKTVLCFLIGLAVIGGITLFQRVSQLPSVISALTTPGEWFLRTMLRGMIASPSSAAMVAFWCNVFVYATIAYVCISAIERPRV